MKIVTEVHRSAITERTEIFFGRNGEMVLYIKNSGAGDTRLYFSVSRLIRAEQNGKVIRSTSRAALDLSREAASDRVRLTRLFRAAFE